MGTLTKVTRRGTIAVVVATTLSACVVVSNPAEPEPAAAPEQCPAPAARVTSYSLFPHNPEPYGVFAVATVDVVQAVNGGTRYWFAPVDDEDMVAEIVLSTALLEGADAPRLNDEVEFYWAARGDGGGEFEVHDARGFLWAGFVGDADAWLGGGFGPAVDVGLPACTNGWNTATPGALELGADAPLLPGESAPVTHQGVAATAWALDAWAHIEYDKDQTEGAAHWAMAFLTRRQPGT